MYSLGDWDPLSKLKKYREIKFILYQISINLHRHSSSIVSTELSRIDRTHKTKGRILGEVPGLKTSSEVYKFFQPIIITLRKW